MATAGRLVVPEGFDAGRFFIVADPLFSAELKDNVGLPGDQFEDSIYSATATDKVSGEVDFQAHPREGRPDQRAVVEAVVPLELPEDRITFRIGEDGRRVHIARDGDLLPEVRNRGGKISGLAWLTCLLLMGLWWLRFGRQPEGDPLNVARRCRSSRVLTSCCLALEVLGRCAGSHRRTRIKCLLCRRQVGHRATRSARC